MKRALPALCLLLAACGGAPTRKRRRLRSPPTTVSKAPRDCIGARVARRTRPRRKT